LVIPHIVGDEGGRNAVEGRRVNSSPAKDGVVQFRVDTLSVAFGSSRSNVSLSMAGRREVVQAISNEVDPKRTPFLGFYEISARTRHAAERELSRFSRLYFTAGQS
jgi:hypothetical protein